MSFIDKVLGYFKKPSPAKEGRIEMESGTQIVQGGVDGAEISDTLGSNPPKEAFKPLVKENEIPVVATAQEAPLVSPPTQETVPPIQVPQANSEKVIAPEPVIEEDVLTPSIVSETNNQDPVPQTTSEPITETVSETTAPSTQSEQAVPENLEEISSNASGQIIAPSPVVEEVKKEETLSVPEPIVETISSPTQEAVPPVQVPQAESGQVIAPEPVVEEPVKEDVLVAPEPISEPIKEKVVEEAPIEKVNTTTGVPATSIEELESRLGGPTPTITAEEGGPEDSSDDKVE
jgi:hypothetical protein